MTLSVFILDFAVGKFYGWLNSYFNQDGHIVGFLVFRNPTIRKIAAKTFEKMLIAEAYSSIASVVLENVYDITVYLILNSF